MTRYIFLPFDHFFFAYLSFDYLDTAIFTYLMFLIIFLSIIWTLYQKTPVLKYTSSVTYIQVAGLGRDDFSGLRDYLVTHHTSLPGDQLPELGHCEDLTLRFGSSIPR